MGSDYSHIFSWDDPSLRKQNGKMLVAQFEKMLSGYHSAVDKEGVAVEMPPAKRLRRGRRAQKSDAGGSAPSAQQDRPSEIKIGSVKQMAIKAVLQCATPHSYRMMMEHLSIVGGERKSAFSESVLSWKHLWPGSPPPDGQVPSEPEEAARRQAASLQRKLLPNRVTSLGCNRLEFT